MPRRITRRRSSACRSATRQLFDGAFPLRHEFLNVLIEVGDFLSFGYGTYDDTEIFRPDTLRESFQALAFFGTLDLLGDRDGVVKRYEYHVSAGQ